MRNFKKYISLGMHMDIIKQRSAQLPPPPFQDRPIFTNSQCPFDGLSVYFVNQLGSYIEIEIEKAKATSINIFPFSLQILFEQVLSLPEL